MTALTAVISMTLGHRSLPDWSSAYGRTPKPNMTVDMVDTVDMVVAFFSSTDYNILMGPVIRIFSTSGNFTMDQTWGGSENKCFVFTPSPCLALLRLNR